MKIRTSSCAASSLDTAGFRTVTVRDRRGLDCLVHQDIVTMRELHGNPVPAVRAHAWRGCIRTMSNSRKRT